jgi:NAD-dependent DNA ligase
MGTFEDDVKQIAQQIARAHVDDNGQPRRTAINAKARAERDITELLGIAKGLLADGRVVDEEAEYLRQWGSNHPDALTRWPASLVFSRLTQMFSDGKIDDAERAELQHMLSALVGGEISVSLGYEGSCELPLDVPPPLVGWHREVFVFTGRFAYGTRGQCAYEVMERGGAVEDDVTRRTTFLVLGTFSSRDWKNTSYGRKIEHAVQLRTSGFPLRIVGEDHWTSALSMGI